jgi:uncharacterized CHY-type Zn-finger protein
MAAKAKTRAVTCGACGHKTRTRNHAERPQTWECPACHAPNVIEAKTAATK